MQETPQRDAVVGSEADLLEVALTPGGIRAHFQPIVSLRDGSVVGHEALARGPRGSALERPDLLFGAARRHGALARLDWACRAAALRAAEANDGIGTLFVNVEPAALGVPGPADAEALWQRASGRDVVLELTERALAARPAELLRVVSELREAGWLIALDDVGAESGSLALMPLLAPDIVKLDLRLVQQQPTRDIAAIVNAVRAHQERTGAYVVAEGIEHERHRDTAIAMGATLGQGWLFGRPQELPAATAEPGGRLTQIAHPRHLDGATPFEVVGRERSVEGATKPLLLAMSHQLEDQARVLDRDVVVLSAFQTAERFTAFSARRYERLARRAVLVGALGIGLVAEPAPAVRGARLHDDDPLTDEWSVVVV
ncbi:MAG TPA: EAL domain-containing protein, partial [Conexibacter sp.]|nr:EAL domain-containing protein [Conexibacter sp.]